MLNGPEKPSRYDLKIKQRKTVTKANLTLLLFMLSGVNLLDLTRCSDQSYVAIVWSLLIYRKSLSRYFYMRFYVHLQSTRCLEVFWRETAYNDLSSEVPFRELNFKHRNEITRQFARLKKVLCLNAPARRIIFYSTVSCLSRNLFKVT